MDTGISDEIPFVVKINNNLIVFKPIYIKILTIFNNYKKN
jgi:hypothetical protein